MTDVTDRNGKGSAADELIAAVMPVEPSPASLARVAGAYRAMAERARYRPAAPSDWCGNVALTDAEASDPAILADEAREYARRFLAEEDTLSFWVGCADFATYRALVYTVEAARALCGCANDVAADLVRMAADELEAARRGR